MGPLGGHLGPILGPSWPPGALLGASLGPPSAFLGHLGAILATTFRSHTSLPPSWVDLGPFGVDLEPSWGHLGTLLGPSGGSPGPPGGLLRLSWGSSGGQRGCMRGCMHSSPALFLSRWPGTSHFLHIGGYIKNCAAPISHVRCPTACQGPSSHRCNSFSLRLRPLSTATNLMKTGCFPRFLYTLAFGLFRFVFSGLELHDATLCTRLCRWPAMSHVVPIAGYIKNCAAHFSPARCPTVFHHAFVPKRFLKPPSKSQETRGGGRSP